VGWFSRKKKTVEQALPVAPAPPVVDDDAVEAQRLIHRWDAAIARVRGEFDSTLAEAVAGSEPLIDATESDLTPLTLPWNTIEARRHKLGEQVSDAWDDISDEMSECDAFDHALMDREGTKRDATTLELEISYLRAYHGVLARASERMRQLALIADCGERSCQYCGATLDKVRPVSEALNVECGYCQAMNTVDPGTQLRMFAAMGAHHLAEHDALEDRFAMMRAEHLIHQYRDNKDVPLSLLEQLEASARRYHSTRLSVEARYNPEQAKYVDQKVARYMKDTERTLKQFWQWRQRSA
jgi:hypothetical protein